MGAGAATLRADVHFEDSTSAWATLDFTPAPEPEEWYYESSEGSCSISLAAPSGIDVTPGGQTQVVATVEYAAWEVWASNYGNTESRDESSGPVPNTWVVFTVESGDGWVSHSQVLTDGSGQAGVTFTMGSGFSILRADLSDGSTTESAYLQFGEEEYWEYQSGGCYSLSLSARKVSMTCRQVRRGSLPPTLPIPRGTAT